VHLHLGAAHLPARVALLDGSALQPGAQGRAQIVIDQPIDALHGDRLILRDQSAERTIGGGMVLDPWPPARGRRRPERLALLDALTSKDAATALRRLVDLEPGWVDLPRFARAWNIAPEELTASQLRLAGSFVLSASRWDAFAAMVEEVLNDHHKAAPQSPGMEEEKLRLALPARLPAEVFGAFLSALVTERKIEADGPWRRLPGHSLKLLPADERLWAHVKPLIEAMPYQPPRVPDLAVGLKTDEKAVRQLLLRLAKLKLVVQVAPDRFFLRTSLSSLAALAGEIAAENPKHVLETAAFRDRIGAGRKIAIEILEFFDKAGITARRGDVRVIRQDGLARI
jgi:selenocysteine-specific elongation factor